MLKRQHSITRFPILWLPQSFLPSPLPWHFLGLRWSGNNVLLWSSTLNSHLCSALYPAWVPALTHCWKKLLWPRPRDSLVYGFKHTCSEKSLATSTFACLAFDVGAGDLNLGPHGCTANSAISHRPSSPLFGVKPQLPHFSAVYI